MFNLLQKDLKVTLEFLGTPQSGIHPFVMRLQTIDLIRLLGR